MIDWDFLRELTLLSYTHKAYQWLKIADVDDPHVSRPLCVCELHLMPRFLEDYGVYLGD